MLKCIEAIELRKIRLHLHVVICSTLLLAFACSAPDVDSGRLYQGFVKPADSMKTAVYWYWVSDNISKEGIVKDLHAMRDAGINRAFIGNIGLAGVPYGEVKMLSDEWWECIHTALKTATELDIEIGIFNSPGWSQSGGPWVKAENSMRYLTSSKTMVTGPSSFSEKLKQPAELFQDVKVLAFPKSKNSETILDQKHAKLSSNPALDQLGLLFDGDTSTAVFFPPDEALMIEIRSQEPFTARSLTLHYPKSPIYAQVELEVQQPSGAYETHQIFEIDRSKFTLEVGFKKLPPLQIALEPIEAKNFRLKFSYLEHDDWPNAAVNRNPGLTEITLSSAVRLGNYAEKSLAKMHPTPLPKSSDYQWKTQPEPDDVSLIVNPEAVIDLSAKMSADGILDWEVPEGEWVILRTGMTPTGVKNSPASPEATGFEVDKMSKSHVEKHFDGHIGEILKRVPVEDRKTFKVVVQDSYEKGGQNFTDGFLQEFQETYGYDPVPFLPTFQGIVVKSQLASDRFLWDVRRLVADKVAYDYVGGLRDVSHEHGLTTWLENYGHWGFPGEFLMYGGQSDEISGEFWSEGALGNIENRAATSCGHIYGKSRIWAESFTCGGNPFSRSPAMLKPRGDRFFAEGINSTLLHVYIHQPYEDKNPGINAWFGNPFNRKNTWFSQMDIFTDYLKRTNYMLQQGQNVADVAYFIGEDAPIMTGDTNPPLPLGYEFDYINAEVILRDMTMVNGLFTLPHGTQYRLLVLPQSETMRPELLAKIEELVQAGGVILGPAPKRSPSGEGQPQSDNRVIQLAAQIWGDLDGKQKKIRTYGEGIVMDGLSMKEALGYIHLVPDCNVPQDSSIHFGHRKLKNTDIYFLSNQTDQEQVVSPAFRVTGKQPELWMATTGEKRLLPAYQQKGELTTVPLKLAPFESVFVVFNEKASQGRSNDSNLNYPEPMLLADLTTNWKVQFDPNKRGPEEVVKFEQLSDWSQSKDDRIKYYSGNATYIKSFDLDTIDQGGRIMLDLGGLTAIARVYINDVEAGGVWTAPYRLDITDFVDSGKNELKIEVINNWKNRLIGDAFLPKSERPTWCTSNPYKAESPLQSSGLFGPVSIFKVNY
ncbi:MAG: glycosyl hydrolase [Cyclobacteriaceae bacterium]